MTPLSSRPDAIDLDDAQRPASAMRGGDAGRASAEPTLVVESASAQSLLRVRGVISRAQIERQLVDGRWTSRRSPAAFRRLSARWSHAGLLCNLMNSPWLFGGFVDCQDQRKIGPPGMLALDLKLEPVRRRSGSIPRRQHGVCAGPRRAWRFLISWRCPSRQPSSRAYRLGMSGGTGGWSWGCSDLSST